MRGISSKVKLKHEPHRSALKDDIVQALDPVREEIRVSSSENTGFEDSGSEPKIGSINL